MIVFELKENEIKILHTNITTLDSIEDEKEKIFCDWEDVLEEGKLYSWEDENLVEMVEKTNFEKSECMTECMIIHNGKKYGFKWL